jgi:molecular chaperone GrpE
MIMSKKDEEKKTPETEPEQTAVPTAEETPAQEAAPEKSETELLQEKLDEANDKYLRMLAEYDNYRRRSQKERENIYADVRADTVKKLLPVYDNLARAAAQEPTEDARKGMEAILTQFKTILTGLGVTEIEAVGQKFDPALHEALLHVEDEKYGEGEIVMELEKGFKLGDKVIRFSKVQVAN